MTSDLSRREIAVGLIVADDGRLLLQHRDDKAGLLGAGRWGLFGGSIEEGERPDEAFLREMDEELGWRPRHFEPYASREVDREGWHVTSHAFAAHLDVPLDALTLGEGQAMGLFTADAPHADTLPSIASLIAEFAASDAYRRMKRRWDAVTATALLVDREGRFLLQHRDDKDWIYNPGMWGSFGGVIEPYETPHDGILRELREELSWQPDELQLYGAYPMDGGRLLIYVFAAHVGVSLDRLVLGEGQGMGFFASDALPEKTVPDLRLLIERFVKSEAYLAVQRG